MAAEIFISYSTRETTFANDVRLCLQASTGYKVWWDQHLQAGGVWSDELDEAIRQAAVVVVIWSARSAASDWVKQEAAIAKFSGKLVPIRKDTGLTIPPMYDGVLAPDLSAWNAREDHPEFMRVRAAVERLVTADRGRRAAADAAEQAAQERARESAELAARAVFWKRATVGSGVAAVLGCVLAALFAPQPTRASPCPQARTARSDMGADALPGACEVGTQRGADGKTNPPDADALCAQTVATAFNPDTSPDSGELEWGLLLDDATKVHCICNGKITAWRYAATVKGRSTAETGELWVGVLGSQGNYTDVAEQALGPAGTTTVEINGEWVGTPIKAWVAPEQYAAVDGVLPQVPPYCLTDFAVKVAGRTYTAEAAKPNDPSCLGLLVKPHDELHGKTPPWNLVLTQSP